MDYVLHQNRIGNLPGIAAVVVLHILIGYALVTGLARRVVEVMKNPLETRIIEEIKKPPPDTPPPPPKLAAPPPPFIPPPEINIQVPVTQVAPAITTVTTDKPPPAPPVMAPPQPQVQAPVRKEFKPTSRVNPTFPRQAIQQGITGKVIAWVHVASNGSVANVEIKQSTNRLFDREVVRALSQWRFNPEPVGFIGEYEIVFNLTD